MQFTVAGWFHWIVAGAVAFMLLAPATGRCDTVNMSWSTVGDPGNAANPITGYGAVPYVYKIGTYDVTVGQYTAFLNAVAATDPYGLYNSGMANGFAACGITQTGSTGNYTYSVSGSANFPVNYVSWGDAARFANWLQNGQPTGPEGSGTTETGAYTLNGAVTYAALIAVSRNPGATIFLPSENEWYKAAYYNPTSGTYWLYPTQSNTAPTNILSATGTNGANFYDEYGTGTGGFTDPVNYLTAVGAFADSPGPFGTYDMGGDVFQWNEADIDGMYRGFRGGAFDGPSDSLASTFRNFGDLPTTDFAADVGFRLASLPIPEPGTIALLLIGVGGLVVRRRFCGNRASSALA